MKCLLGLLLSLFISAATAQIKPADGLWGTTDNPAIGSGLMMTTQNGITVISVFTYDETGKNTWYISSGRVDEENVFRAELIQSENGQNLTLDNPQSATFVEQITNITIEFQGSQLATMQIGEAESKEIRPNHFGYATTYEFPDITGKWVIANVGNETSYLLDLVEGLFISPGVLPPIYALPFESNHPSTESWQINCVVGSTNSNYCSFRIDDQNTLEVHYSDIGNQEMELTVVGSEDMYQAFRLNQDSRLLPNDGLWRPADDPAIGSGMAIRTQGDFTVILLYSYDEAGSAVWQNAAGQFDENGKLVADLYTPNNGTAIESTSPSSAEFEGEPQTLEVQLEGTELATFSINGSEPKYIQNLNFGIELLNTEIFQPVNQAYTYPSPMGQWVMVDTNNTISSLWNLFEDYPNGCQSPPNPLYFDSVVLSNGPSCYPQPEPIFDNQKFRVLINCINSFVPVTNVMYPDFDFCYGDNYASDGENDNLKINFSDIGFNQIRFYTGPDDPESYFDPFFEINRNSPMFRLYRLD